MQPAFTVSNKMYIILCDPLGQKHKKIKLNLGLSALCTRAEYVSTVAITVGEA